MATIIRIVLSRTFLFIVVAVLFFVLNERYQWVDSFTWTGGALTEETGSESSPIAPSPLDGEAVKNKPPTPTATTPKTVLGTSIVFSYPEALRDESYYVEWWAEAGSVATVRVMHPDGESSVVPGCSSLSVKPGIKQYCMWKPGSVDQLKSREGFTLQLTTYTSAGDVVATAKTKPFTMVTTFMTPLTSFEDEMYGWSVRYPEGWQRTTAKGRVVIAKDKSALQSPLASDEALVIEFCSLAREECYSKKEAFKAAPSAREGSLGGKRTTMRVTADGDAYLRRDLVERSGILFITSVRAVTPEGGIRSPYTRKAFAEFRFEPPKLSSETYELSRSSRSGSLILEFTDMRLTYARLVSTGTGCETDLDTTTFKSSNKDNFSIVRGMCTITGVREGEDFVLTEDDCESVHDRSCTFEGTYDFES